MPSFLNLMNIELRVIRSDIGVSLLFVLEPEVWRATRQFDSLHLASDLFVQHRRSFGSVGRGTRRALVKSESRNKQRKNEIDGGAYQNGSERG